MKTWIEDIKRKAAEKQAAAKDGKIITKDDKDEKTGI
jgi:hypothetical protein